MPPLLVEARVRERRERLRLRRMATVLERVCAEAGRAGQSHLEFLDQRLEAEQLAREERAAGAGHERPQGQHPADRRG